MHKAIIIPLIIACSFSRLCGTSSTVEKIMAKEKSMQVFLQEAVTYIQHHSLPESCHEFSKNWDWHKNDMFICVIAEDGLCYVFGNDLTFVGYDFAKNIDPSGLTLMQRFDKIGTGYLMTGLDVPINNTVLYTCFTHIEKDKKKFVVLSAFYAHEADMITYGIIRKTLELFDIIGIQKTAAIVNDMFGTLRRGDIYISLLKNGDLVIGHGAEPVRLGQNIFNIKSAFLTQRKTEYEDFLRNQNLNFTVLKARNKLDADLYIQKYVDPKTKTLYIIGAAAHSAIGEKDVVELVNKAITYLKNNKKEDAFDEFTTNKQRRFKIGESMISVYDEKGLALAHGEYPDLVGFNRTGVADEYGQYVFRDMIDQAMKFGNAWITVFDKNAYKSYYAQKLELPFETFIVMSGYWPLSKTKITEDIVEKGVQILERFTESEAFEKFCDGTPNFLRGDIKLTVVDQQGSTLVDGNHIKTFVWTRLAQRDALNKNIITKVLEKAKNGSGWIEEKLKTTTYRAYIKSIQKNNNKKLILYAGYFE